MPAKLFKDFNKDTKDLLTKQYIAVGDWKLESKIKPADSVFGLNPGFEAKGKTTKLSVDVDYNVKAYGLETKTTFFHDGTIKPKWTWKKDCCKAEFTLNKLALDSDFEFAGETTCPLTGAALYTKITKAAGEASAAYAVCAPATIGAGVKFATNGAFKGWSAGVRATHDGYIVNVVTNDLKSYTTGVFAPIKIGSYAVKAAAQVECGGKFDITVGVEVPVSDFTVKAKVNKAANVTVALVRKFADKWTAAATFTVETIPSFGLTLTRE